MLARLNAVKDSLFLVCIMAGTLFVVPGAFALGLGEVTLSSSLNEPLDANMELLDTADLDESQIVIELGSQEDYARAGLERPAFLSAIQFDIELVGDTGTVHLTTTDNVVEPFLNLIVSARWPNGRLQREYTLLVDLPAFTDTPATQPELPVAPGETAEAPAMPARDNSASVSQENEEAYTVEPGDSLWEIARDVRPDDSVTVQQTMLAIQRNNQDAFLDNNINRIITGRVLRIPALQEIQIIDQAVAVTEVGLQNNQLGGQPLAGAGNNARTAPLEDELRVLTNDPEAPAEASTDGSNLAAMVAALENELLISEENLDRARLENQELTARLSSLEEEIDLLENIVALEDQRIAQLQAELATQSAATVDALAEAQQAIDELNALENGSATPQGLLANALEILRNNLVWIAVMVALVLSVVGFLILKSRREEEDDDDDMYDKAYAGSGFAGMSRELPPDDVRAEPAEDFSASRDDEYDNLLNALDPDDESKRRGAADDMYAAGSLIVPDDENDSEQQFNNRPNDAARNADASDLAIAAAAMAAMDAEAEQAAERDLTDAEKAEIVQATDEPEETGLAHASVPYHAVDTTPFSVATPEDNTAVEDDEPEIETSDLADQDNESFEFTLREPDENEDGASVDIANADAIEKFDFKLQNTAIPEDDGVDAAGMNGQSTESDPLPELGELNFDDSMLSDDTDDDYLAHHDLDECDTKLDLATAYEAMGDVDDAIEILNEVIAEGNEKQIETAERLKQGWQSA